MKFQHENTSTSSIPHLENGLGIILAGHRQYIAVDAVSEWITFSGNNNLRLLVHEDEMEFYRDEKLFGIIHAIPKDSTRNLLSKLNWILQIRKLSPENILIIADESEDEISFRAQMLSLLGGAKYNWVFDEFDHWRRLSRLGKASSIAKRSVKAFKGSIDSLVALLLTILWITFKLAENWIRIGKNNA